MNSYVCKPVTWSNSLDVQISTLKSTHLSFLLALLRAWGLQASAVLSTTLEPGGQGF